MTQTSAKVIKHSSYNGVELLTLELEYPRFILAEINTHRAMAKSTSSNRAIPTATLLDMDIFIPSKVGINKSGK